MWHGSLESDALRSAVLDLAATASGGTFTPSGVSFAAARQARLDLLADLAEKHLDVDALLDLAERGAPAAPVIGPYA